MHSLRALVLVAGIVGCRSTPPTVLTTPATAPSAAQPTSPEAPDLLCLPPPSGPRPKPPSKYTHETPLTADLCEPALLNVDATMARVLEEPAKPGTAPHAPWDRKSKPTYLDLVRRRFALADGEVARLGKDGFAVLGALERPEFASAYHDIYRSQLPVYVTVDSVLHAVFASHDAVLADLETRLARPRLEAALTTMHCGLGSAGAAWPVEIRRDVDLYLGVARRLLGRAVPLSPEAEAMTQRVLAATGMSDVSLFGRTRRVDFTTFAPRGHYTASPSLASYFRAARWLSGIELNLVSRGNRSSAPDVDARETPREAVVALALSELAQATWTEADLEALGTFARGFAGGGENVSPADLVALRHEHDLAVGHGTIDETAARLRAAIAGQFRRTVRTHTEDQVGELATIASLFPEAITADAKALGRVGHPHVPHRHHAHAGDVGMVLGHDRAKALLTADLAEHPGLAEQLALARADLLEGDDSLHHLWLSAVRGIAERPKGVVPSFFATAAHDDLRLSSALAGYAGLRHAHVLLAAQPVYGVGCEIPDGWVEPAPATYRALTAYAARGAALVTALDPSQDTRAAQHFRRLGEVLAVLTRIAEHELAGKALTAAERRFLAMVAEIGPGTYDGKPRTAGWYFELFEHPETARRPVSFVADYATGEVVSYLGVRGVRLGLFVVDAGGAPRVMVGPVASAAETFTRLGEARLDDRTWSDLPGTALLWPSASSHVLPATAPAFTVKQATELRDDMKVECVLTVEAPAPVGPAVLETLDHHSAPTKQTKVVLGAGTTTLVVAPGVHRLAAGTTRVQLPDCNLPP